MRRVIVHLIRGEAGTAHEAITKDLTQKFDTFPLHNRIPPHLTLKRWFELDERGMEALYICLDDFASLHQPSDYLLKGFGSFGKDVMYIDVLPSAQMRSSAHDLMTALYTIPNLTFDEFDGIEDDFHATVAMGALKPFDYEQVWDYLKTGVLPDFKMKFDNIAVLKKENEKWLVERVWELQPEV